MDEPRDFSDLICRYQVLCTAISFFEPMDWSNPTLQAWLTHHDLSDCASPWQLPPAALWILVQSLERKFSELQTKSIQAGRQVKL